MRPCPWCILQRLLFLLIALVALGTGVRACLRPAAHRAQPGDAAARHRRRHRGGLQHEVAAKSFSCNLTFADKVISGLGLDAAWPWMFQVSASCAEAAARLFGVPFEFWSLALFVLLAVASAGLALRAVRVGEFDPAHRVASRSCAPARDLLGRGPTGRAGTTGRPIETRPRTAIRCRRA